MTGRPSRDRLYRLLLLLYPRAFRERFGAGMEETFARELAEARDEGPGAVLRLRVLALVHVLAGASGEWWSATVGGRGKPGHGRGDGLMTSILSDARIAARGLWKRPGFTAVIVFTLALGIGANTAIFSVVNAVLLTPLPYHEPDRLAFVWGHMTETSVERAPFSGPDVADFREHAERLGAFAAFFSANASLSGDYEAEQIRLGSATLNFFEVMGAEPTLGRGFAPEDRLDMDPGVFNDPLVAPPPSVAVLSWELWRRRYAGSRDVLGRRVLVNGQAMTVVGVAPRGFRLYLPADAAAPGDVDVWTPLPSALDQGPRDAQWLTVVGRLADGATWEEAREEMDALATRLREEHRFHANVGTRIDVTPMHADVVDHVRGMLVALVGAVGFVLLIACANVANLLLVRAGNRGRETAIRMALGGERRRIVRQMLTESAVLALLAGVAGVVLAWGAVEVLLALRPESLPRGEAVGIDGRVLGAGLLLSFLSAALFGTAPALHGTRGDLARGLGSRGVGGTLGSRRLRDGLVVVEVALSLVLLIGAGLMLRSFVSLRGVEPGFEASGVLTAGVTAPIFEYRTPDERVRFFREVTRRIEAIPAVEAVGGVTPLPLSGAGQLWFGPYALTEDEDEWSRNEGDYRVVVPGYFEAVGAELLRGRDLTEADSDPGARRVVVVDEKMAAAAWPGEDPLGRRLLVMRPAEAGNAFERFWAEVVGVVEHIRYDDVRADSRETVYFPLRDWSFAEIHYTVRTAGDPAAVAPAVREAVAAVDPDVAPAAMRPFRGYVDDASAPVRFSLLLIGAFALVALALAAVGLYGVVSYSVVRRTREIGVRMAFGAERSQVVRLVLGRGLGLTLVGVALGVVGAALLTRVLSGLLYGVGHTDPATYAAFAALLVAVSVLAAVLPARRAMRIEPSEALREE